MRTQPDTTIKSLAQMQNPYAKIWSDISSTTNRRICDRCRRGDPPQPPTLREGKAYKKGGELIQCQFWIRNTTSPILRKPQQLPLAERSRIYTERSRSSKNSTSVSRYICRPFDFAQGTGLSSLAEQPLSLAEGRRIYAELLKG